MRKRLLTAFCAAALILTASGCGGDTAPVATENGGETTPASGEEAPVTNTANDISSEYEWGNVEIVGGGYTSGIYYNKAEQGLIYARTDIGGLYRMDKETGRWKPLTDQFNEDDYTYYGIDGVAVDEKEPNRVYALAGMYKSWKAAVLCSEDYGETWEITPLDFAAGGNEPNRFADRLMLDPNDNSTLYLGSRGHGLWVSHDYGKSFTKVESFPTLGLDYKEDGYNFGITAIAFDPSSSADGEPCKTIYVGTGDRMSYVTYDGGETWEEVADHPKAFLPCHIYLENDLVYFVFNAAAGPYQVRQGSVRSFNPETKEWKEISPDDPGHGWGDLEFDPNDTKTLYISTMGKWGGEENDCMWRSTDGGESWTPLFTGDGIDKIFEVDYSGAPWLDWGAGHAKLGWMMGDLEIDPFNSDEIMYGTGATIFRSTNLTKWGEETVKFEVRCAGLEETAVQDLEAANSDEIRLYSAMGDIDGFTHTDVDKVMPKLNGNGSMTSTFSISCGYNNPEVAVRCGSGNNPIAITTDGGNTWKNINKPKGVKGDYGSAEVNCDGTIIYWTNSTAAAIYKTYDYGQTWEKLEKAFAKAKMAADAINPEGLHVYTGGMLYASQDAGKTFKSSVNFIPDGCSIEPNPEKEGELYMATSFGGVFVSTEYAQGEMKRLGIQSAECVAVGAPKDENSPMTLYAIGTNDEIYGVWRSTDAGETWQRINDDKHQFGAIGNCIAADLRVFGQVYFGTNGRGIIMGRLK